jgi:Protein of unknown function (DUF1761)
MPEVELVAVLAATAAAFVSGGAYYAMVGAQLPRANEPMPPWKLAVEVLRCLILAAVVAGLALQGRIDTWTGGLVLGVALWIGFPLVLWIGAVIHENTPLRLAVIHGGDWLVKLLLVAVIVAVWQ